MRYDEDDHRRLLQDLAINKEMLDEEAICQPQNYFHACEGYAFAVSRRDKRKHELEIEIATLDRDVRDAAEAEGVKITEPQVKHQISREPDYDRRHRAWLSACLEADRWQALQNAYRQRADMLRGLIQLHQTGYFGEVTGAGQRGEARSRVLDR